MSRNSISARLTVIVLATAVICGMTAVTAPAQEKMTVAEGLAKALDHRIYGRFDEGIAEANQLLQRDDISAEDSVAIYEVLSIIYYSKGQDHLKTAYEYLDRISKIGPCVAHLPHDIWPKGLRTHWYSLASAQGALVCPDTGETVIQTIAIMPFDNHSVGEYQEELGALGAGLASFFQYDFAKISSLRVVERDKIDYIIKEQDLAKSDRVDQTTALKAGKLLNAHVMVFGSFTQIDRRQTRIVARAVNVETSEVIASAEAEGAPKYFDLEKELVDKLCKELNVKLSGDEKQAIDMGGTESLDATTAYARGLEFEDDYNYEKAYEYFKTAYELDNEFTEAKRKMDIYRPLAT
jgi:TolB-like protein